MSKTIYLITIVSVLLINSKTSFGQGLKKELGICGKTVSAIFKIAPEADPIFSDTLAVDDEFCDHGRYEQNANFVISLYNSKDELVYDKYVYLNTLTFQEGFDKNNPGKFQKTKITEGKNSRIIKFPVSKEMGEVTSYKVQALEGRKTYDKKKINW